MKNARKGNRISIQAVVYILASLLLMSCGNAVQQEADKLSYAKLLRMKRTDSVVIAEIMNPWNEGTIMKRYLLVRHGASLPHNLPEGEIVRVPLRRPLLGSSIHASLLCDLGKEKSIVALCDTPYIHHPELKKALSEGKIANGGLSYRPSIERWAALQTDALLLSSFEDSEHGVLAALNVPIIECADYLEPTALGRAEWMLFYGELFDARAEADSLFTEVKREYLAIKNIAQQNSHRKTLLCDLKQGGTWFVPGGNSYLAQLYADAGIHYLFADRQESGSVALSFETVYSQAKDADIWLIKHASSLPYSYQNLASEEPLYRSFRPWKERQIYQCNTLRTPIFEEVAFHPERLLREVVGIFYPHILPNAQLRYFSPLEEQ